MGVKIVLTGETRRSSCRGRQIPRPVGSL